MNNISFDLNKIFIAIGLVLLISVTGCGKQKAEIEKEEVPVEDKNKFIPKYRIVEIEGCEYFSFISSHGFKHITHKGNCKNPIHIYNVVKNTSK